MTFRDEEERRKIQDEGISSETSEALPNQVDAGKMALMQSYEGSAVQMPEGTVNAFDILQQKIGKEQIHTAMQTLQDYKSAKANLEARVIDDQQWYKMRHWEIMRRESRKHGTDVVEPTSAWLFNTIENKHATAMDNFPAIDVRPREQGDTQEAKNLSEILPVILEQNDFEQTYSDHMYDKLISGGGIYGVFWDKTKLNGLGDIAVESVDVLNLFWEPGIQDIERSRNVFYVDLVDNDVLEADYPTFRNKLGGKVMNISEYIYDDSVDTTKKSIVVDWYYKKRVNGQTVLHYCKFIMGQEEPLFATENEAGYENGWYADGQYPFVIDPLFRSKGTPYGFGFVDVGKSNQEYIDRSEQAILKNLLFNAKPRHFIRSDGSVNEAEYSDSEKDLVHVDGNLGSDSVMPITVNPLSAVYQSIINDKINELKETTGNRDVSAGGTTGGVTAASAVAAMQEAGAKLDRDNNKASYRAFRKVCIKVIERIRQFYDAPRYFRIVGENGSDQFVQYSNAGIQPQAQGTMFGMDLGYRLPLFDLKVTAEKQSPYTKMSQNELALQFYSAGFFNPQQAPAALACLNMMDFDSKDSVLQMVAQNGNLFSMLQAAEAQALQLAQIVDAKTGSQLLPQLQAQYASTMGGVPGSPVPGKAVAGSQEALGGNATRESSYTADARKKAAEASAPV